jgi:acyl-coenzyme A thioesterase PaaI-like protein
MADTIPMRVTEASPGYVKFHARADRRHVNPLGGVRGGTWCASSDSPDAGTPCCRTRRGLP